MSQPVRRASAFRSSFVAVVGAFGALEGCTVALDPSGDPRCADDPLTTPGCVPSSSDVDCPPTGPSGPCARDGMYCEYGDCYGSATQRAYCDGGTWTVNSATCNPPAPPPTPTPPSYACPTNEPVFGGACAIGTTCDYGDCYGFPTKTYECTTGVWSSGLESTCNPPRPPEPCPADLPTQGTFCNHQADDACGYDYCGFTVYATCVDFAWDARVPTCNPPEPDACPVQKPAAGSACGWTEPACSYPDPQTYCPEATVNYTCVGGSWSAGPSWVCNPPPPLIACPDALPSAGSACLAAPGQSCHYGQFDAACPAGSWSVYVSPLYNPPAPTVCPANLPIDGADCLHVGSTCSYGSCPGTPHAADCINGKWDVSAVSCTP